MASEINPPSVSWAQRKGQVYITFNVECAKPDIKIENKSLFFKGTCAPEQKVLEVSIPLYAEINPEKSKQENKGRYIEVILAKDKLNEPFWPTLTTDKKKPHWLKVDFNRWQEEDDSDVEDLEMDNMNDLFSDKVALGKEDSSSGEEEDLPDLE